MLQLESFGRHAGNELIVELRFSTPADRMGERWQDRYTGIENHVYAEIEGLGRIQGLLIDQRSRPPTESIIHRFRFTFDNDHLAVIRAGAEFGFGVDDDRMRVGVRVKRQILLPLLGET
ncbi:MAG: DUF3501 family protein [Lysobacteraceae bacterium]